MWLIVDEKMDMVDLLFKWVLFMIRFLICSKKGILLLFQKFLNFSIVWNLKPILLYYLAHTPSILVLYTFLWSVPISYMVYRRRTPAVVSSETLIHLVAIMFHLSVSPLSIRCSMRSAHSWTQNFLWSWIQGQYQPWGKSPPLTLWTCPSDLSQSVPGHGYNFPSFDNLKYIRLLNIVKPILNGD